MATVTSSFAPDNTNATTFRLWGSSVDNTFATLGWVQTSDTGQVNWATVSNPSVINTAQGYSIFRMNDTLQSTKPVFIKMEYGCGSVVAYQAIWVTIGTGSDGAGNITGVLNARQKIESYSNQATAMPCYFSGSSSRWCCALWTSAANAYMFFIISIERTKDSVGALTNDGLMFFTLVSAAAPAPTCTSRYMPFVGTGPAQYTAWNSCVPLAVTPASSGSYKNTAALYPVKCWTPGESGPSSNLFLYQDTDITPSPNAAGTVTLSLFDGNVTSVYLPLNFSSTIASTTTTNRGLAGTHVTIAMRYE